MTLIRGKARSGRALRGVAGALLLLWVASVHADPDELVLQQGERGWPLSVAALREQATQSVRLHDPFAGREIRVRGLVFRDFLIEQFGEVPRALAFEAWDGHALTLEGWDDPDWILATHQDGAPLTLRSRGPLRLVKRHLDDRDPANMRAFYDWLWMIRRIEALP